MKHSWLGAACALAALAAAGGALFTPAEPCPPRASALTHLPRSAPEQAPPSVSEPVASEEAPPVGNDPRGQAAHVTSTERARSLLESFNLDATLWERYRTSDLETLERELGVIRHELESLSTQSEEIHARADRAMRDGNPRAAAYTETDLEPVLEARRALAARMMVVALAKRDRS